MVLHLIVLIEVLAKKPVSSFEKRSVRGKQEKRLEQNGHQHLPLSLLQKGTLQHKVVTRLSSTNSVASPTHDSSHPIAAIFGQADTVDVLSMQV
mmetsp:Transcript_47107/g.92967  ORF Transcript_47107/g.92967 Transcript_47107/m.92967 type:complete len:94 (-) Transcript_47107:3-284(-)